MYILSCIYNLLRRGTSGKYGKPLWLTEFACADSTERKNMSGQMQYMAEAVPQLEADPTVARYAWFSYNFELGPSGINEASLLTDGRLNALGELYYSFWGNATVPEWAACSRPMASDGNRPLVSNAGQDLLSESPAKAARAPQMNVYVCLLAVQIAGLQFLTTL